MPATTSYLPPPKPISLYSILDTSNSKSSTPTIDLEWEPFRAHVEAFLNAIDDYNLAAKTEIASLATEHVAAVRDLHADKEEMERRIQVEKAKEGDMFGALESERLTVADLQSSVNHLHTTLTRVREQSATLEGELNSVRKEVKTKRTEKERQGKALDEMRNRDGDELRRLEEMVGWKIEGVKDNILLMRFTLIDPSDPDREFAIVMDVTNQEYTATNCSPPIPNLGDMVRQLNADREFFTFVTRVRKAFRASVPNPPNPSSSRFDDLAGPGLRTPGSKSAVSPSEENGEVEAMDGLEL